MRQNIRAYGGDPSFIVVAGGSAGAHLASLAALTPNDPEYQEEMPDVDTAVQGCVAFYGVFDFADRDAPRVQENVAAAKAKLDALFKNLK